jgi:asparagine synthase (glutamine-hydrolysing)
MAQLLKHRGPDSAGTWVDRKAGVALSHRRLAIVDLSSSGAQPMASACGRYIVSYNGEIYNYLELRRVIEARKGGWSWRGTSDTEVLLALFSCFGVTQSLRQLDGMFAMAVWDRKTRTLLLARDRFGEKPLSYAIKNGILAFGSELQAVSFALHFGRPDIDPNALAALMSVQTIPAPMSIFAGVRKLPAACYLQISQNDLDSGSMSTPISFWSTADIALDAASNPFGGTFEDAVEECRKLLTDSVKSRMIADVPIGAMLSSGTDSTCITALAQAAASRRIKTYTISVEGEGFNEADVAAEIAQKLETEHHTVNVGYNDCLAAAQNIATRYDEPFADQSQIVTYVLANAIRSDVTVALSGDGGDELFAGYTRHIAGPPLWDTILRVPRPVCHATTAISQFVGEGRLASLLASFMKYSGRTQNGETKNRIQKAIMSLASYSEAEFYGSLISQPAAHRLLFTEAFEPDRLYQDFVRPDNADASFLRNMMLSDVNCYLPETIMTKVDRASMAVSLESRAPFLNPQLLQFAWSLPASFLVRNGRGKAVTRELAASFVGREALSRPKQGFAVPMGSWLLGPLKEWASDTLTSSEALHDPFLNLPEARKLWLRHQSGSEDCSGQIWPLLSYLSWKAGIA